MPDVSKTSVSLRFHGDDLDPDRVTSALGKQPTIGVAKGNTWVSPRGGQLVSDTGRWLLRAESAEPGDLDRQISSLFQGLTEDLSVWRHYAERYNGNIFTGMFLREPNEGISISALTLTAIGTRGLELGLDLYAGVQEIETMIDAHGDQ